MSAYSRREALKLGAALALTPALGSGAFSRRAVAEDPAAAKPGPYDDAVLVDGEPAALADGSFTIAVLPDTQNYMDYTHQKAEGFPFDASEQFMAQMRYIAANVESAGGDIAFVSSLGDVWQHQSLAMDPEHERRGFRRVPNPIMDAHLGPTDKVHSVEMPLARAGFALIDGKVPFSVVPGNHDYDAMWTDAKFPPAATFDPHDLSGLGTLHPGGLNNFRAVFGADQPLFKGKPWYVDSHDGGADSAQVFAAAGYRFLHIGLQFDALFEPAHDSDEPLYLAISRHAIDQAMRLREALLAKGYPLFIDSPTNQQFVVLDDAKLTDLAEHVTFGFWEKFDADRTVVRFATSWATRTEDVDALIALL